MESQNQRPSFKVTTRVRDAVFDIECGDASQTIKWLALVAAWRYALHHENRHHPNRFVPVNVTDSRGQILFPDDRVDSLNDDCGTLIVELIGPSVGANDSSAKRPTTLWEKYAFIPRDDWVEVCFEYKRQYETSSTPAIYGNFNSWGEPLQMNPQGDSEHDFTLNYRLPPGADVVFRFIEKEQGCLSSGYSVIDTPDGKMNYMKVKDPDPTSQYPAMISLAEERESAKPIDYSHLDTIEEVAKILPQTVVGAFKSVRSITDDLRNRMFERDWSKMQFADVVRKQAVRLEVKEIIRKHFEQLRLIFQYYSSHGAGAIVHMSIWEFINFCHQCEIPDNTCTITTLDQIFNRVNVMEVFDEDMIEQHPQNFRNAMHIITDPYNPSNAFIRGEFLESLIRIAVRKFPSKAIQDSLTILIEEYVLKHALNVCKDTMRQDLLDRSVQTVYKANAKTLHKLFEVTAELDKGDVDTHTISVKEFQTLLERANLFDEHLPRRRAMQAYALSQELTEDSITDEQTEDFKMVYSEFLESLGRIAAIRHAAEKTSLAQKLTAFLKDLLDEKKNKTMNRIRKK